MELHLVGSLIGLSELRQMDPALQAARLDSRRASIAVFSIFALRRTPAKNSGEGRRIHGDQYRAVIRAAACQEIRGFVYQIRKKRTAAEGKGVLNPG